MSSSSSSDENNIITVPDEEFGSKNKLVRMKGSQTWPSNDSSGNTPIGEKIDKIERQICEGKLMFVDDDGNPLVPTDGIDKCYGTNSLLEQWRDSYPDNDDYDPYDDDMSENLHSICDDLSITVRGRKKK
ncbi:hypothetical protein Tco_1338133 [Tanacetum coccineum]